MNLRQQIEHLNNVSLDDYDPKDLELCKSSLIAIDLDLNNVEDIQKQDSLAIADYVFTRIMQDYSDTTTQENIANLVIHMIDLRFNG